jgi:titin
VTESANQQAQFAHLEQRQQQQQAHHAALYADDGDDTDATQQAPVFTTSLRDVHIREGQRAHFECRIIPVSDPNLTVEWLHNGQPIKQGI